MDLQRLNLKLYLEDESSLSSEDAFRIFNAWIPQTTDEVLIDVADYTHLPHGPQTLLVGHEANYSLDNTDRRLGLMYARKQPVTGTAAERFGDAFAQTLKACLRLEEEASLQGKVRFQGSECWLLVNDRLHAANDEATLAQVRTDLESVLDRLYAGASYEIAQDKDPQQRFSVHIRSASEDGVATLLRNLGS